MYKSYFNYSQSLSFPSCDTNYWTYNLPNDTLLDYPPNFTNNEIISPTIQNNNNIININPNFNNNFNNNIIPQLYEDAWTPLPQITTIPCTYENPNPNPNYNHHFNQNDLNDQIFLLNNPNDNDYLNDQSLNTVIVDGINMGSMQEMNILDDDNYMFREIKNNNNINNMKVAKIETISYEEIRKYFDMPISKAAKELNVGLTVLKKRCRELNIKRWPHRKIKSLESLISNVKELGLLEVVQILEEHKRKIHFVPGLELNEETKKLRQACFKANYKKRRASLASTR
ncbi:hypothetical protein RND81_05G101700 [Saponaria officinalis]|uniref:RWP-RK domain-containing protein n=1 Tax=Saponaria officinalis TaxID=3572 RepID=A0AAW1KZG2_SAPOF